MPALVDTSAVLAAVDANDPAHTLVIDAIGREASPLLLPVITLPEVAFLLQVRHGAQPAAAFMARLVKGSWPIVGLETADLGRAAELMARYADSKIGFVDAALAALAERLAAVRIYTLDRRDFSIIRPAHVPAFEILPLARPTR